MIKVTQEWLDENIDKGLHYAIKNLNEKGYETAYCCEGHWNDSYQAYIGMYISFTRRCIDREHFPRLKSFSWKEDDKVWSKCKNAIIEIDGGYKNKIDGKESMRVILWTGTRYKRMSRAEKDAEHEQFLKELNEWVDSLPICAEK